MGDKLRVVLVRSCVMSQVEWSGKKRQVGQLKIQDGLTHLYLERKTANLDVYPRILDPDTMMDLNPKLGGVAEVQLARRRLTSH
jgi:hypothetical protein